MSDGYKRRRVEQGRPGDWLNQHSPAAGSGGLAVAVSGFPHRSHAAGNFPHAAPALDLESRV